MYNHIADVLEVLGAELANKNRYIHSLEYNLKNAEDELERYKQRLEKLDAAIEQEALT